MLLFTTLSASPLSMLRATSFGLTCLYTSTVSAHPGHGGPVETPLQVVSHYLVEPVHASALVALLLLGVVTFWVQRKTASVER